MLAQTQQRPRKEDFPRWRVVEYSKAHNPSAVAKGELVFRGCFRTTAEKCPENAAKNSINLPHVRSKVTNGSNRKES
jgi:hypothetical protein